MVDISFLFMLMLIHRKEDIVKKNAEALLVGSKENGLEVNADKTKHVHGYVSGSECRAGSQCED